MMMMMIIITIIIIINVNLFLFFRAKIVVFAEQYYRAWVLLLILNCFFSRSVIRIIGMKH